MDKYEIVCKAYTFFHEVDHLENTVPYEQAEIVLDYLTRLNAKKSTASLAQDIIMALYDRKTDDPDVIDQGLMLVDELIDIIVKEDRHV